MLGPSLFDYLAAFATIVLAIALTDLVQSTHRLIRARDRIKWDVLPLLLAAIIYLAVLSEFFSLWQEVQVRHFSFYQLVWMMTVPTVVAFAGYAALPDEVSDGGIDLTQFYFSNRRYLVTLLLLYTLGDFVRSLIWIGKNGYLDRWEVWLWYGLINSAAFAIFAVMWFAKSRRVQLMALLALFAQANISYFQWAIDVPAS